MAIQALSNAVQAQQSAYNNRLAIEETRGQVPDLFASTLTAATQGFQEAYDRSYNRVVAIKTLEAENEERRFRLKKLQADIEGAEKDRQHRDKLFELDVEARDTKRTIDELRIQQARLDLRKARESLASDAKIAEEKTAVEIEEMRSRTARAQAETETLRTEMETANLAGELQVRLAQTNYNGSPAEKADAVRTWVAEAKADPKKAKYVGKVLTRLRNDISGELSTIEKQLLSVTQGIADAESNGATATAAMLKAKADELSRRYQNKAAPFNSIFGEMGISGFADYSSLQSNVSPGFEGVGTVDPSTFVQDQLAMLDSNEVDFDTNDPLAKLPSEGSSLDTRIQERFRQENEAVNVRPLLELSTAAGFKKQELYRQGNQADARKLERIQDWLRIISKSRVEGKPIYENAEGGGSSLTTNRFYVPSRTGNPYNTPGTVPATALSAEGFTDEDVQEVRRLVKEGSYDRALSLINSRVKVSQ